jgi:hypothetical protein
MRLFVHGIELLTHMAGRAYDRDQETGDEPVQQVK